MPALSLLDESSYGHGLRPFGGATAVAGQGRGATAGLVFDGSDDYHMGPGHPSFLLGNGMFTIELDVALLAAVTTGVEYCALSVWRGSASGLSWFMGINGSRALTFYTSVDGGSGAFGKVTPGGSVPASGFAHLAVSRDASNTVRLFVEGTPLYTGTDTSDYFPSTADLGVGAHDGPGGIMLPAAFDNVRITNGVCRYDAPFTPPGDLPVGGADAHWANVSILLKGGTRPLSYKAAGVASAVRPLTAPPGVNARTLTLPAMGKDLVFGGRGRVAGTVMVKGTPNFPVHRRTRLIEERSGICIREMWSDPVTGEYAFDYVDEARKYTVIAYDYEANFRAVVADNLTPSLIP